MMNDDCKDIVAEFVGSVGAACALRRASTAWQSAMDRRVCAVIAVEQPEFRVWQRAPSDDGDGDGGPAAETVPALRLAWNQGSDAPAVAELACIRTLLLAFPGDVAAAAMRLALAAVHATLSAAGRDFTVAVSSFSIAALDPPGWLLARLTSVVLHLASPASGVVALLARLSTAAAPCVERVVVRRAIYPWHDDEDSATADRLVTSALVKWLQAHRSTLRSATLSNLIGSEASLATALGQCTRLEQLEFPAGLHDDSRDLSAPRLFSMFLDAARAAPERPSALRILSAGEPPVDVLDTLRDVFPRLVDVRFKQVPFDFYEKQRRIPAWLRRLHPLPRARGIYFRDAHALEELSVSASGVMSEFGGQWWAAGAGPRESVLTLGISCDEQMPLGSRGVATEFPNLTELRVSEPLMFHFGSDSESDAGAEPVPTCLSSRAMSLPASLKTLEVSSSDHPTSRALLGIGSHLTNLHTIDIDCFDTEVAPLLQIAPQLEDLSITPPGYGEERAEPPSQAFVNDVHAIVRAATSLRRLSAYVLDDVAAVEGHPLLEQFVLWVPSQHAVDRVAATYLPRLHTFCARREGISVRHGRLLLRWCQFVKCRRTLPRLHTIKSFGVIQPTDAGLGEPWEVHTGVSTWSARLRSFERMRTGAVQK